MEPVDAKRRLLASTALASPDDLAALFRLCGLADRATPTMAHCLRCHAGYDVALSPRGACKIEHSEDAEIESYKCKPGYEHSLPCCRLTWNDEMDDEPEPPTRYCISARHTTSIADVRKHHRTDEEIEEYGDFDRRGRILETCAQAGCIA